MNLLDIFGSGRQPGTDRPDRLVSDHQIGRCRAIRERPLKLAAADIQRLPGIALVPGFADADDGGQPRAPGGFRLLADQRVALAMVRAALRMADNNGAGACIRQHLGREVTGMGA